MLFVKWPVLCKGRMVCPHVLEREAEEIDKKVCASVYVCLYMCEHVYGM